MRLSPEAKISRNPRPLPKAGRKPIIRRMRHHEGARLRRSGTKRRTLLLSLVVAVALLSLASTCRKEIEEPEIESLGPNWDIGRQLSIAAKYLPKDPIVLQAGAFRGKFPVRMAEYWPEGTVYTFEPVPYLAETVREKAKAFKNLHFYELALSDKVGTAVMHLSEMEGKSDYSGIASTLLDPEVHERVFPQVKYEKDISVRTTTIDAWAAENDVSRIDFLFLDIEGAEFEAMKAAPRMMKKVKVIFSETGFVPLFKGRPPFGELRAWLEKQGFRLVASEITPEQLRRQQRTAGFNVMFAR